MGKPVYDQGPSIASGRGDFAIRNAQDAVDRVASGANVAPDVLSQSVEALGDALWRGESSLLAGVRDALSLLIGKANAGEVQAQALGEVIAAGSKGAPVLQRLAAQDAGHGVAGLSPDELRTLGDSLSRPAPARLAIIASLLEAERSRSGHAPEGPASEDNPQRAEATVQPRSSGRAETRLGRPARGEGPAGGDGGTPGGARNEAEDGKSLETVLQDRSADAGARLNAALLLGEAGIPVLRGMMRQGRDEQEVAAVALAKLGDDPKLSRRIHDEMRMLESEPHARKTAEYVRRGVEAGRSDQPDRREGPVDRTSLGDGWLARAIAACDGEGILQAAFGRERLAIPMALRKLAVIRAGRSGN